MFLIKITKSLIKKNPYFPRGFSLKVGGVLLSQRVAPQVPSTLVDFTSVFGMGTGVSPLLSPPQFFKLFKHSIASTLTPSSVQALDLLVSVSYIHYCTYTSDLSTSCSIRSLTRLIR